MNKNVWIERGKTVTNYVPRVQAQLRQDADGNAVYRLRSSGGGAPANMLLHAWSAKRWRSANTHPGKRGKR